MAFDSSYAIPVAKPREPLQRLYAWLATRFMDIHGSVISPELNDMPPFESVWEQWLLLCGRLQVARTEDPFKKRWSGASGTVIMQDIFTNERFYTGCRDFLYLFQHCACKTMCEAVVESMGGTWDRSSPDDRNPSFYYVKNSMKVIRPLVTGVGVANKYKPELFMAGTKVTPHDDLESIREQSKVWLPKEIDTGHGWVKHGIQKLINYKNERLLGIESKPTPRVEASLRTEEGGVALDLIVPGKAKKPAPKRKREAQAEDPIQKIREVKALFDEGALTSEAKKAELLARI